METPKRFANSSLAREIANSSCAALPFTCVAAEADTPFPGLSIHAGLALGLGWALASGRALKTGLTDVQAVKAKLTRQHTIKIILLTRFSPLLNDLIFEIQLPIKQRGSPRHPFLLNQ